MLKEIECLIPLGKKKNKKIDPGEPAHPVQADLCQIFLQLVIFFCKFKDISISWCSCSLDENFYLIYRHVIVFCSYIIYLFEQCVDMMGPYLPTILKDILCLNLQIFFFLCLAAFECNTTSDWLNHTV